MKYCEKCPAKNGNFDFCYDIANVLWRFSPQRERVTLQTSCGAERFKRTKDSYVHLVSGCNNYLEET